MVSAFAGNRGQNSSFLVLNVGDNTLGLCNPFMIPKSSEANQDGSIESKHHDNAIADSDVVSSSMDDASSESQDRKPSKDSEDPNWLPKKKARWSSSSSCEAAKPKSSPSTKWNTSEVSPRNKTSLLASISGSPPEYLVSLLSYFGWRVVFQPDSGDYIYTSPTGHSYFSLPKAFESFLQETSKYKGKPWFTSQFNQNMVVNTLPMQGFQTTMQKTSSESANNCTKNNERDMRRICIVDNPMKILKPVKKPRTPRVGLSCKRGNALLQKPLILCKGLKQTISPIEDGCTRSHTKDKASDNEFIQTSHEDNIAISNDQLHFTDLQKYEEIFGPRRSARLSGRHVPIEGELDLEATDKPSCSLVNLNVSEDKGECTSNAHEESFMHRMPSSDMTKEPNEDRKSSFSVMSTIKVNHSTSNMERHSTGRHVLMHGDNDSERMTGKSSSSQISTEDNRFCENMHYAKNRKISDFPMEDGANIHISEIDAVKRNCLKNVFGISKSMFVNQNVCLHDESGTDVGAQDELFETYNWGTRWMSSDENFQSSFCVVGSTENTNLVLDNSHMLETMKDLYYEESINKQSVDYDHKKNVRTNWSETEIARNYLAPSATQEKKAGGRKLKTREKNIRDHHLVVRTTGNKTCSSQKKLTMLSWLLDSGIVNENDKVLYIPKNKVGNISCGMIIRDGIWCDCCKKIMSLSDFGTHADGIILVPWDNLYLMSGKTLSQCLKEAWDREKEWAKVDVWAIGTDGPDPSDDTCGVCADGGHLICCDGCPSTFHQECLRLEDLPEGSWYCPYCRCKFCMMAKAVEGANDATLLECKQCGHKFHRNCAEKCDSHEDCISALFCGRNCKELATKLSDMLYIRNPMEGGFSWTLLKCLDDEKFSSDEQDFFNSVCKLRLSMALYVLNECFNTLVDQRTGVDMIRQAVYNRRSNFHRLNYEGFYTLILEKDDEIISVATLRFIGPKFAEMPFIGTRPVYQRQGMCHRLLKAIEDVLSSLCIKELIIPAIPDLLETWMTSFSFRPLEPSLKNEIRNCSMVNFPGTFLLQKSICNSDVVPQEGDSSTKGKDFHGKSIPQNKEFEHGDITPKDADDQECWNQEHTERLRQTSRDTWRIRGTSGCTSNFSRILLESSDRAVSCILMPGQQAMRQSLATPSSSPAVMTTVQYTQSPITSTEAPNGIASGKSHSVSMSNGQRDICLQSGYEPKDIYSDIVASTLSFDNLLRMVN